MLLIEAGGRDWNPLIHVPAGFFKMLDHDTLTWKFRSEPDPGTNGRAIVYTRGRVIGGSSSINGLIYIRGQPEDYDHWAQLGNRGWSWDDCLPYFRQAERWEGEGNEVRGKDGPLFTSKTDRPPICATVVEAGKELGLEYREDVNDLHARPYRLHRLVPADPRRPPPRHRRAHLSAAGVEAAEPRSSSPRRWCIACCSTASARSASNSRAAVRRRRRAGRCGARGDPVGGRDRLAAHPATFRGRRSRASRPDRRAGRA